MEIHIIPHNLSDIKHIKLKPAVVLIIIVLVVLPFFIYKRINKPIEETLSLKEEVSSFPPALEGIEEKYEYVKDILEKNEGKVFNIIDATNYSVDITGSRIGISSNLSDNLVIEVEKQMFSQQKIFEEVGTDESVLLCVPSISPTRGRLIREFGYTTDPFTGEIRFCQGIDILSEEGEDVYATANGIITFAGWKRHEGYVIEMRHKRGITTRYSHLSRLKTMKGRRVERRDVIACVGKTGKTEGPRLHYEVWKDGKPLNPRIFILETIKPI